MCSISQNSLLNKPIYLNTALFKRSFMTIKISTKISTKIETKSKIVICDFSAISCQ